MKLPTRASLSSLFSLSHFSSVSLDSDAKLRAAASVCLNNSTAERWMRSLRSGGGMGGERGEETDEGKTQDNWEHPGPSAEEKWRLAFT